MSQNFVKIFQGRRHEVVEAKVNKWLIAERPEAQDIMTTLGQGRDGTGPIIVITIWYRPRNDRGTSGPRRPGAGRPGSRLQRMFPWASGMRRGANGLD